MEILLKTDETIANLRNPPEFESGIIYGPVLQLQQRRELSLIELTDAFSHVLAQNEIKERERLEIVIIVSEYPCPSAVDTVFPRDRRQRKRDVGEHVRAYPKEECHEKNVRFGPLLSMNASLPQIGGCRHFGMAIGLTGGEAAADLALAVRRSWSQSRVKDGSNCMPIKPQGRITREIIQIAATMQAKALAFDSEHPDNALGTCSASTYARAIRALLPETEELAVGTLMLEAGAEAMGLLLLARANTELPT